MSGILRNFWDDCVFHVDYRTGLTKDWTRDRVATVTGTPKMQIGSGGKGMNFDGNLDWLTYGTDYTGFSSGNEDWSISAVVEYNTLDNYRGIVSYGNNVVWGLAGMCITTSGYSYKLLGDFRSGGITSVGPINLTYNYVNRLVFLMLTYEGSTRTASGFANGIHIGTPGIGVGDHVVTFVDPITVGRNIGGPRWLGTIYTGTIFNKALTEEEVRIHTKEICNNSRFLMQGR